jgi:hypothetical protein
LCSKIRQIHIMITSFHEPLYPLDSFNTYRCPEETKTQQFTYGASVPNINIGHKPQPGKLIFPIIWSKSQQSSIHPLPAPAISTSTQPKIMFHIFSNHGIACTTYFSVIERFSLSFIPWLVISGSSRHNPLPLPYSLFISVV